MCGAIFALTVLEIVIKNKNLTKNWRRINWVSPLKIAIHKFQIIRNFNLSLLLIDKIIYFAWMKCLYIT